MSNLERFSSAFIRDYEDVYTFIDEVEDGDIPYGGRLEADNTVNNYDSYGAEDSILEKIYYFSDFDIYIKFSGTRQSYSGEEWDEFTEVKPTSKTITIFE